MLTFAQAKALNPKFGPTIGDQINSVVEMFLASGKWKNSIREFDVQLYPYDDNGITRWQFTLPRHFETALGVQFNLTKGRSGPGLIQSQWFKYVNTQAGQWGWWNSAQNGNNLCYSGLGVPDLGDGWATYRDIPVDAILLVSNDVIESSADTVNIRGVGTSGQILYTTTGGYMTEGINYHFNNVLPVPDPAFMANAPIVVVKPVTKGVVTLFYQNASSPSDQGAVGIYQPGETVPSYRRYQVPNPPQNITSVRVAAKLRYVPLVSDNDLVIPENSSALTYGLEAWNYENAHNADMAKSYWDRAYTILNGSLREHQGTSFKAFEIVGGSSFGCIPKIN